jgi:hypothetical protein
MILELAGRVPIDPEAAAELLELAIVHVEQVTAFRREYQLGTSALWADATAIVGGLRDDWRVIDLVPRDLSLAALRLDPPHEVRPHLKHTNDGAVAIALDHHFAVRAGTLVIRTAATSVRIERITFTTDTA